MADRPAMPVPPWARFAAPSRMAAAIVRAAEQAPAPVPDRGSLLASLLWRLAPNLYLRLMAKRFAGELD